MTSETKRTCGSCKACCTALKVDEIPKAEWQRCKHLGPLGCRIYRSRPESCQAYACAWLQGFGGKRERPDRLGVIFSTVTTPQLGDHVIMHELWAGASRTPEVQRYIQAIASQSVIFWIMRDSMRKLLGGPHNKVTEIIERARALGLVSVDGAPLAPDITTEQFIQSMKRAKVVRP